MSRWIWRKARSWKPTERADEIASIVAPLLKRKPAPSRISKLELQRIGQRALEEFRQRQDPRP